MQTIPNNKSYWEIIRNNNMWSWDNKGGRTYVANSGWGSGPKDEVQGKSIQDFLTRFPTSIFMDK